MSACAHPSYDPAHFEAVSRAGERHFWFRHRNALLARVVRDEAARLARPCRLLEMGCGAGNVLAGLERRAGGVALLGLDLHHEGLLRARPLLRCALVQADVARVPFAPGTRFELVGAFDVIEHLDDDRGALAHLARLVVPGDGRLLVTVPAGPQLWSLIDERAGHRRRYDDAGLRHVMQAAGLETLYLTHFMAPLYPFVRAARALAWARRAPETAVADELRVRPGWNALCHALLLPERWVVGRRLRVPWGSSLLAVARLP